MVVYSEELHLEAKQRPRCKTSRSRNHQAQAPLTLNEVHAFISFNELRGPRGPVRGQGGRHAYLSGSGFPSLLWPPPSLSWCIQWFPLAESLFSTFLKGRSPLWSAHGRLYPAHATLGRCRSCQRSCGLAAGTRCQLGILSTLGSPHSPLVYSCICHVGCT